MNLEAFQMRLGVPLAKATHPDDFAGLRNEVDSAGLDVVDHTNDLKAHPPGMDLKVEEYRKAIGHQAPLMRVTPGALEGHSAKVLYKVHSAANLPNGKPVLVKPYHEKLHPKTKFWQNHLIQGWAEMTNQALYHAAGMGDIHQQVHVSEHDMGPGFDKHPALVVHLEPETKYIHEADPSDYSPQMASDAVKIGIMDFLSNNIDRHRHNLLVRPEGALDHTGMPYSSRLVAIDHSRSFQYHAAHKGVPEKEDHPFFGPITIPQEIRDATDAQGKAIDNPSFYIHSDGLMKANQLGRQAGAAPLNHPDVLNKVVQQWWPGVRNRVVSAFINRLDNIKEPRMREHLLENFQARVQKLDEFAAHYGEPMEIHELDVPLKVWDR